ncbi:MAG: methionine biosynthesis protein MetW [Deltaproteobacteria bacterium]|jgi:methionine biosynthesis protein MetW|nr:methionine biosynthesis protein MetW [Deltaproteobacteria bacterium]
MPKKPSDHENAHPDLAIIKEAVSENRLNFDPKLLESLARVYDETAASDAPRHRWQDRVIVDEIPRGAYVLDLGCGRGELLGQLIKEMDVHGQAVEVDPEAAMAAMELGVPVLNIDLSEVLGDFSDQSFDYIILESTVQTLKDPLMVLGEMLRVGKRSVVSFPNFGHWRTRYDLSVKGRMPVTESLPFQWHDTPNIRVLTLSDFMDWCRAQGVKVLAAYGLINGHVRTITEKDNLMVKEALMFITRE